MAELILPFQFSRPMTALHERFKAHVKDLEKHGFCILPADMVGDRAMCGAQQLELFREACRQVSLDQDRNLVISFVGHLSESALCYLAERTQATYDDGDLAILLDRENAQGTLPESFVEDEDGKGVLEETGRTLAGRFDA